jgi:hypothetical protein
MQVFVWLRIRYWIHKLKCRLIVNLWMRFGIKVFVWLWMRDWYSWFQCFIWFGSRDWNCKCEASLDCEFGIDLLDYSFRLVVNSRLRFEIPVFVWLWIRDWDWIFQFSFIWEFEIEIRDYCFRLIANSRLIFEIWVVRLIIDPRLRFEIQVVGWLWIHNRTKSVIPNINCESTTNRQLEFRISIADQ